jgi:transcriptional regulator with GAF, ATPase, and Fis domain
VTQPDLSERIAAAARTLSSERDVQHTLAASVGLATELIDGCDEAGVSVVYGRRTIETTAATSDLVATGDKLQYEFQEGPCLDAIWDQETVHSPDLASEVRWPVWGPRVVEELGVRSMLCFRLFTAKDTLGALNLYSRRAGAFTEDDAVEGLALAAHVAVALVSATEIEGLNAAAVNRTVIGQAQGILMERYDIDSERAFSLLRRVSQDSNQRLRWIAAELVRTRKVPGVGVGAE